MDKTLQTTAWNCLPREFREEVKMMWKHTDKPEQLPHDAFLRGEYSTLTSLFGIHNLTSDAEGEEMLTVSRAKVIEEYKSYKDMRRWANDGPRGNIVRAEADTAMLLLDILFGSKCLPDELNEGNFAKSANEDNFATKEPENENHPDHTSQNSAKVRSNRNLSQEAADCDNQFDNILTDSFRKHNRLHIASMVIASIMGSENWTDYRAGTREGVWRNMAKASLDVADALISECGI